VTQFVILIAKQVLLLFNIGKFRVYSFR